MTGIETDVKNKVFLITGGTSGVGKAVATGLAKIGAKIVIISRSAESGKAALSEIATASGNDQGEFLAADLSLQSSILNVGEEFKRKYDNLHVLANLAGAMYFEKQITQDGIDKMLAVNYLSHFLLTHQLLDMLKESRPSRVITVAGAPVFLKNPTIDFADFQLEKNFSGLRAAGQTLYARTLFSFELAKRLQGSGVTSVAFHPGLIKSNMIQNAPWLLKVFTTLIQPWAKKTCDIGVYLAAAREVEKTSGVFYDDKKQIVPILDRYDEVMGATLWSVSQELTKIKGLSC